MDRETRERLGQQMDFILELDREKDIFRQTSLSRHGRKENDAEHAWHMAVMAYLLQEYADEPFDVARAMLMCLIHDVVEIDAGDTYAYDSEGKKTQKEREERAAERLFGLLPKDQGESLKALFEEFEAGESPEARFVRAMDNFQPLMLNDSNGGSDWLEHGVTYDRVLARQSRTEAGSKILAEKTMEILRKYRDDGTLPDH